MVQKRGRKSGQDIAAKMTADAVAVVERPAPELNLTPEEADVWVRTVNVMPADWFRAETFPLLEQWCRHTVTARRVSQLIDHAMARDAVDQAELKELLGMQAKETSSLKALAASMRISQQASYTAQRAGTQKSNRPTVDRPWD